MNVIKYVKSTELFGIFSNKPYFKNEGISEYYKSGKEITIVTSLFNDDIHENEFYSLTVNYKIQDEVGKTYDTTDQFKLVKLLSIDKSLPNDHCAKITYVFNILD